MDQLKKFKKNIYSQNGEDGVIEEVCRRLNINAGEFVEFGAWDGKHLSNTFNLLTKGWRGVYIEGDEEKFNDLLKLKADFPDRLHTICAFVSHEGPNTLDELLLGTDMSKDFDLLSIDIDSFDWHVWYSLINYQPKVVIIEINSSIPPGIFQTHRDRDIMGSSFTATLELGKSKGYTLVCHTGNMFFVRDDYVAAIGLSKVERDFPEVLFDYTWCLNNKIMPYFSPEKLKGFLKKMKQKFKL